MSPPGVRGIGTRERESARAADVLFWVIEGLGGSERIEKATNRCVPAL